MRTLAGICTEAVHCAWRLLTFIQNYGVWDVREKQQSQQHWTKQQRRPTLPPSTESAFLSGDLSSSKADLGALLGSWYLGRLWYGLCRSPGRLPCIFRATLQSKREEVTAQNPQEVGVGPLE